jgi:hypothetical protein
MQTSGNTKLYAPLYGEQAAAHGAAGLVGFIKEHGISAHLNAEGKIVAADECTVDGVPESRDVVLEPNLAAVKAWLGY